NGMGVFLAKSVRADRKRGSRISDQAVRRTELEKNADTEKCRFTAHPVLLGGMVGITLTFVLIPACSSLESLGFVLAVMGFSMGVIDTTANVSMISVFGSDVSPFLQVIACVLHRFGDGESNSQIRRLCVR